MFSVLAGIIPLGLSLQNGGFDTVCPLSASGGQLPPMPPPGSAAYVAQLPFTPFSTRSAPLPFRSAQRLHALYLSAGLLYVIGLTACVLCTHTQSNYECFCDAGWTKGPDGIMCNVDVDECRADARSQCSTNPPVQCINTPGSFTCGHCPAGLHSFRHGD